MTALGLCEILCNHFSEKKPHKCALLQYTVCWLSVQVSKIRRLLNQPGFYSLISQIGESQGGTEIKDTHLCDWK